MLGGSKVSRQARRHRTRCCPRVDSPAHRRRHALHLPGRAGPQGRHEPARRRPARHREGLPREGGGAAASRSCSRRDVVVASKFGADAEHVVPPPTRIEDTDFGASRTRARHRPGHRRALRRAHRDARRRCSGTARWASSSSRRSRPARRRSREALTKVDGLGVVGGGDSAAAVRAARLLPTTSSVTFRRVAARASSSSRASNCPAWRSSDGSSNAVGRRIPLIAGNWKMNLDHLQSIAFVQKLAWTLKDARHDFSAVEVAVFPPFTDLRSVQTLVSADKLPTRLRRPGCVGSTTAAPTRARSRARSSRRSTCSYVIIGHSERRAVPRRDRRAGRRQGGGCAIATTSCRSSASARPRRTWRPHGPSAVPVAQLRAALAVPRGAADIVVAYEPVWAIGSGQAATPEQAEQVVRRFAASIAEVLGDEVADATRILYGGSVKSSQHRRLHARAERRRRPGRRREPDLDEFACIVRYRARRTCGTQTVGDATSAGLR